MNFAAITEDQYFEALESAVAERGEGYTYDGPSGCVYEHNNQPSCLIGLAVTKLGAPIELLKEWDECRNVEGSGITDVAPVGMPDKVVKFYAAAQRAQDDGDTWGEALGAAERLYDKA